MGEGRCDTGGREEWLSRVLPYVCVVTAGAAVMVLELVGSRVLAPYFGGTTIIWTALIGIIMASLASGYWWGGRLADRHPDYRVLPVLFMAAGTAVAALAFGKEAVLAFVSAHVPDLRLGATLATLALFAVPSFLLAAIGPFVIRVEIREVVGAGATVGRLSAASTAGSIAGTFLAGFVLIASVGHFRILLGLAATLLLVAALCYRAAPWRPLRAPLLLLVAGAGAIQAGSAPRIDRIVHDIDSRYARMLIAEQIHAATGRPVRGVFIDIYGAQSAVFLDGDGGLVLDYQRAMRLLHHFRPDPRSLLTLGGGVGAVARDFLARAPAARVDLVEIDPAFTELGRRYFGLRDDPRLAIFHQDARTFVRHSRGRYDAVVIDVFSTLGTVPYQLTTVEFVADLSKRVAAGGVVLMNLVSAITSERAWFLRAEAATYARHFPRVEVFQLDPSIDPAQTQNLVLVAVASEREPSFDSPDPELAGFLRGRWTRPLEPFAILTDDFAPVDYYYAKAVF
jgi:spermidine synthase